MTKDEWRSVCGAGANGRGSTCRQPSSGHGAQCSEKCCFVEHCRHAGGAHGGDPGGQRAGQGRCPGQGAEPCAAGPAVAQRGAGACVGGRRTQGCSAARPGGGRAGKPAAAQRHAAEQKADSDRGDWGDLRSAPECDDRRGDAFAQNRQRRDFAGRQRNATQQPGAGRDHPAGAGRERTACGSGAGDRQP